MNIKIIELEKLITFLKKENIKEVQIRPCQGNDKWYEMPCDGYTISIPASSNNTGKMHATRSVQEEI